MAAGGEGWALAGFDARRGRKGEQGIRREIGKEWELKKRAEGERGEGMSK